MSRILIIIVIIALTGINVVLNRIVATRTDPDSRKIRNLFPKNGFRQRSDNNGFSVCRDGTASA